MKNYGKTIVATILIVACVFALTMVYISEAEPLDTYHGELEQVKDSDPNDGQTFAGVLALATNEGAFGSKLSDAYHITSRRYTMQPESASPGGAWMFHFYGTDAADETFSFTMVGWAKDNGMAQVICEGNGILGTQDVVTEPNGDAITSGFWADTIEIDETTKWPSVAVYNSGDNECAILVVDMTGLEWVSFVTYDCDGTTGVEAASIGVYGRPY